MIADDRTYIGIHAMGNPEVETPDLDAPMKAHLSTSAIVNFKR